MLPLISALAMRLLIPVGFMPVFTDQGVGLAWCRGMAPPVTTEAAQPHHSAHGEGAAHKSSRDKPDPDEKPADHSSKSTGVCTFAATAMAFAEAPTALPELAPDYEEVDWLFPVKAMVGRGLAAPPPPQTGPPFYS